MEPPDKAPIDRTIDAIKAYEKDKGTILRAISDNNGRYLVPVKKEEMSLIDKFCFSLRIYGYGFKDVAKVVEENREGIKKNNISLDRLPKAMKTYNENRWFGKIDKNIVSQISGISSRTLLKQSLPEGDENIQGTKRESEGLVTPKNRNTERTSDDRGLVVVDNATTTGPEVDTIIHLENIVDSSQESVEEEKRKKMPSTPENRGAEAASDDRGLVVVDDVATTRSEGDTIIHLGNILDSSQESIEEEKRNKEASTPENRDIEAASENQIAPVIDLTAAESKELSVRGLFSDSVEEFFTIFDAKNLKEAERCVRTFATDSKIASNLEVTRQLWDLANGKALLPAMWHEYTLGGRYTVTEENRTVYFEMLGETRRYFIELIFNTHEEGIKEVLRDAISQIDGICADLERCKDKGEITVDNYTFDAWKFGAKVSDGLKKTLEEIEQKPLTEFLASLAVLTMNRSKDDSRLVQGGLNILRMYVQNRYHGSSVVGEGTTQGVASTFFNYCFRRVFQVSEDDYMQMMHDQITIDEYLEEQTRVAQGVNVGRHFVSFIQGEEKIYKLDTLGGGQKEERNHFERGNEDPSNVIRVNDKVYDILPKINVDNMCVPQQNTNNCYLASGWLPFCALLHYHNELRKINQKEQK